IYLSSIDGLPSVRLGASDSKPVVAGGKLLAVRGGTLFAQSIDGDTGAMSGEPVAIAQSVRSNVLNGRAAFAAADRVLLYRTGDRTPTQLTWVDRSGKRLSVMGDTAIYGGLALSPDGRRLAVVVNNAGAFDIWAFDVARGVRTRVTFGNTREEAGVA